MLAFRRTIGDLIYKNESIYCDSKSNCFQVARGHHLLIAVGMCQTVYSTKIGRRSTPRRKLFAPIVFDIYNLKEISNKSKFYFCNIDIFTAFQIQILFHIIDDRTSSRKLFGYLINLDEFVSCKQKSPESMLSFGFIDD